MITGDFDGLTQGAPQGLEDAFSDVMLIGAMRDFNVEIEFPSLSKSIEKLLNQLGIERADLRAGHLEAFGFDVEYQGKATGQIQTHLGQRFIGGGG